MQNLRTLCFVDTFDLLCSLRPRIGLFLPAGHVRELPLRSARKGTDPADGDFVVSREASRWTEFKTTLGRLKRAGEAILGGELEFGRIYLEMLDAGGVVPWRRETDPCSERFVHVVLPLRSNPMAVTYSGIESATLAPGWLTIVNVRVPYGAVNFGDHARIHLVLDVRGKQPATE